MSCSSEGRQVARRVGEAAAAAAASGEPAEEDEERHGDARRAVGVGKQALLLGSSDSGLALSPGLCGRGRRATARALRSVCQAVPTRRSGDVPSDGSQGKGLPTHAGPIQIPAIDQCTTRDRSIARCMLLRRRFCQFLLQDPVTLGRPRVILVWGQARRGAVSFVVSAAFLGWYSTGACHRGPHRPPPRLGGATRPHSPFPRPCRPYGHAVSAN